MLKKALYLGLFIFTVNILLSALACKHKVKENSYCRSIHTTTLTGYRENNSQLSGGDNEIVATTLRLQLNVLSKTEVCMRTSSFYSDLSTFSTAYALWDPSSVGIKRLDSIINYDIVSDSIFDPMHPAGSSLKGIFTSDDEYILKSLNAVNVMFNFYCDQAPANIGTHIFTVKLVKNDGTLILVKSIPIRLLK